jgi:hypothetical protein
MKESSIFSRRYALRAFAASLLFSDAAVATEAIRSPSDALLLTLGAAFDAIANRFDTLCENRHDLDTSILDELSHLLDQAVSTRATTLQGFCVKARIACWVWLGDLDDTPEATADQRITVSMVRDLIQLHAPQLERSGSLRMLLEGVEANANQRVTNESLSCVDQD